jgi:hypothetical protein
MKILKLICIFSCKTSMASPNPPPIAHIRSVADIEQELALNPLAPGEVEFKLLRI